MRNTAINRKIVCMKYGKKKIIVRFITFYKTVLGMFVLFWNAVQSHFRPTNKAIGTRNHEVVMNKSLVGQIGLVV